MSEDKYAKGVVYIKNRLSRYTHASVLRCALAYLGPVGESKLDQAQRMPWVVMFLLKMAVLGENGKKEIPDTVFYDLANKVFHLQGVAANFKSGSIELSLRAMVLSQLFYQIDSVSNLRELVIQATVYRRDDRYYDDVFHKVCGLTLDSYFSITLFLMVRLDANSQLGVLKVPISELVYYLCPKVSYAHLLAYIRLVSCELVDLSGFMEGHDLGDVYVSEYFQETPFKYVPFILEGEGLVALNYNFCITSLCNLVPAVLKKEFPAFKDKFGTDMELRVGSILSELPGDELLCEKDVESILKGRGLEGKLVDYVYREGDSVTLVECKAIEPSDLVKCTSDPEVLKKVLAKSYIYAIHQGQRVAAAFKGLDRFKGCSFRLLVVTYGDHYIFGGRYVSEYIDSELYPGFEAKYGEVPLVSDRMCYVPLQSFTSLVHCLKEKGASLGEFLDEACDSQSDPNKRRLTISHTIEEEFKGTAGAWIAGLGEQLDVTHGRIEEIITHNMEHWRAQPERFISMYGAMLKALRPAYHPLPL